MCVIIAVNLPKLEVSYRENELSDSLGIRRTRSEMLNDESDQYNDERDVSNERRVINEDKWNQQEENQDSNEEIPHFLKIEKQPYNWHTVQEVINRQIDSNPLFHRRFYGSLFAVERLSLMYKFTTDKGRFVTTLDFNQKGNLLASACVHNSEVFIWDWAMRKKHCITIDHTKLIWDVKWLPLSMEYLVTCMEDEVRLLDLNSNISDTLVYHDYQLEKAAVHPEIPYMVFTVGQKEKVFSIDIRDKKINKLLTVLKEGTKSKIDLCSIHFNPLNSNEFCVSGFCKYVRVYDRRKVCQTLYTLCPDHLTRNEHDLYDDIRYCEYNHDGTQILASYEGEAIYLFDKLNSSPVGYAHKYQGHVNFSYSDICKEAIFFGPKSEYIISGSRCGYLVIWDKNTEAIVQWLKCGKHVPLLKGHALFPILATAIDKDIGIWMPLHGKPPDKESLASWIESNVKTMEIMKLDALSQIKSRMKSQIKPGYLCDSSTSSESELSD